MAERREILFNEVEATTGDFGVNIFDRLHPQHGKAADVNAMREKLSGLTGHNIQITIHYTRTDRHTHEEYYRDVPSDQMRYNSYNDIFGTLGFFPDVMHQALEENSEDGLSVTYMEIDDFGEY